MLNGKRDLGRNFKVAQIAKLQKNRLSNYHGKEILSQYKMRLSYLTEKKYEKEFFCFPCSCCRVENNVAQNFCLEKYEHYNPTKEIGDENVKKKDFLKKKKETKYGRVTKM